MRVGFDHYTIGHRELTPEQTLEFAVCHGLDGVQWLEPSVIDPGIDLDHLAAFRRLSDQRGLYLEVGLPSPNPVRRARLEGRSLTPEQHAADLRPHVAAVAALGCTHARAYVGDRHDRFRTDTPWVEQCRATTSVLKHLAPVLRDNGVRVAVETHADLTCDELLRLIDQVGDEVAGVTLDTGNLAMRLDDPLQASERLAPHVLSTHVKDAVLAFTDRGLCWQARPIGTGGVPIAEIVACLRRYQPTVALSIEMHPRTYDIPIFDATWLAFFPELRADGLAAIVLSATRCERRYADGSLARPETIEAVPWAERDLAWLTQSVRNLRELVGGGRVDVVPLP